MSDGTKLTLGTAPPRPRPGGVVKCPSCGSTLIRWRVGAGKNKHGNWISTGTCQMCESVFQHTHPQQPGEPKIVVKVGSTVSTIKGPGATSYTPEES